VIDDIGVLERGFSLRWSYGVGGRCSPSSRGSIEPAPAECRRQTPLPGSPPPWCRRGCPPAGHPTARAFRGRLVRDLEPGGSPGSVRRDTDAAEPTVLAGAPAAVAVSRGARHTA
jgi:hypothetical protein